MDFRSYDVMSILLEAGDFLIETKAKTSRLLSCAVCDNDENAGKAWLICGAYPNLKGFNFRNLSWSDSNEQDSTDKLLNLIDWTPCPVKYIY